MKNDRMMLVLLLCLVLTCLGLTGCECAHEWSEPSCSAPAICTLCNEIQGAPTGHVWNEATCSAPRTYATCNALEAVADHKWGKDAKCVRCDTEIPLERLRQLVSFQTSNSTAQMKNSGEQVFVRHLWVTSDAPFDITIQSQKLTARTEDGYWQFPPYIQTITPELGTKKSTISTVYDHADDRADLTTPKTIKGSFMICMILENSPLYYDYIDCSFEFDIKVGDATYLVKVTDDGDTWTLIR